MLCTLRAGRIDTRVTSATCSMNHDMQPTNVGRIGRQDFLTSNRAAGELQLAERSAAHRDFPYSTGIMHTLFDILNRE
jgi:hypothetical protein